MADTAGTAGTADTAGTAPGTDVHDAVPPARTRSRRRWLIAAVLAAVLVAVLGGVAGWRWLHGARVFDDGGNGVGGPIPVGRTGYSLVLSGAAGTGGVTVDLRSVTPHVVRNTAQAAIRVLVCRENGRILLVGASPDTPYCTAVQPFAAGVRRFSHNLDGAAVVLAITPNRPGRVVISGVDVVYRYGVRYGAQRTGLTIDYVAR